MASFKNSGSAVDAILGFSASEFLGEVSDAVDAQLVANLEGFQRELQAAANSKGYSSKGVTSAKLEEQCQRLLERMRRHFSKNMGKFELYASRNIFVLPTASSSSSSSGAGAGAGDSGTESSSLEHVTAEVEQLRAKYAELQSIYTALSTESRDGDLLVKDMRAALYAIRVGYQSFDEQQLPEIIASMNRDKQKLEELCHRATGTCLTSSRNYTFTLPPATQFVIF